MNHQPNIDWYILKYIDSISTQIQQLCISIMFQVGDMSFPYSFKMLVYNLYNPLKQTTVIEIGLLTSNKKGKNLSCQLPPPTPPWIVQINQHMSNDQNLGYVLYVGDSTTLYKDYTVSQL